jgi:hypothetical protein
MRYKDGPNPAGKNGSRNKSKRARLAAIEEACKKIANADSSGITGDAQALLTVISKPSHFHLMCVCGLPRWQTPASALRSRSQRSLIAPA